MIPLWGRLAYDAAMEMKEQLSDRAEADQAAGSTVIDALEAQRNLRQLRSAYADKIDTLVLIGRAMWELVRASNNLSEDDLLKKVTEVDLSDGTLDGKIITPPKKCSSCNRVMSKRHRRCIYCGAEERLDSAFDSL
jgi:hypothetical protein